MKYGSYSEVDTMPTQENAHAPTNPRRDELVSEWLAAHGDIPETDLRELRFELQTMLAAAAGGDSHSLQLAGAILLDRVEAQIDTIVRARR